MDIKMIDQATIEKTIRMMVTKFNADIHDKYSWWNGALNAYLEVCGLSWDVVEKIEKEAGF
jgi:hypothetical protein